MQTAHPVIMFEEFLRKYAGRRKIKFKDVSARPLHMVIEIEGTIFRVRMR